MARSSNGSVPLRAARRRWLERQVAAGRFRSVNEAVDHYIREAARIERAKALIDDMLLEAINGPPASPMTEKDWEDIRRVGRKRIARANRRLGSPPLRRKTA